MTTYAKPLLAALALSSACTPGSDNVGDVFPDCEEPTASLSLVLSIDGVVYDPASPPPPQDRVFFPEGTCAVASAGDGVLSLDCVDPDGVAHAFELAIDVAPAVALPAVGTVVHMDYYVETDDLSDRLAGYAITLREGTATGALLLVVNGGHAVVLYDLDGSFGPTDVCPFQELDENGCIGYRRTMVFVDADGTMLEAFDHGSVDANGLRMVVGDAVSREVGPRREPVCSEGGLGPGFGRFSLVIGPPA